jgi:hypothetical protein
MMRFKFIMMVFILFSLALFPSRGVLALNGTVTTKPDQNRQSSDPTSASSKNSDQVNQEPQPTPTDSEGTIQDNTAATRRVFLPAVFNPQTSFYVATYGSDSNPGTLDRPWRTLQKAANTLVAGHTLKILPGTYYESITPKNSGNASAYITYTADPGTVILDGSGLSLSIDSSTDSLVQIQGKSYIKVQNLTIRNSTAHCVNIISYSDIRPSFIEITGLNIQNCNDVGIRVRSTDHLLVKDNQINHINYSSGIGVWWSTNVTVDHNTITNAHYYHECQGAYEEALTISGVNHFEVMNNTLDNTEANPPGFCSRNEKLGIDVKESSQNGLVHHNTVRHMTAAGIYVDGWHAGANGTPTLNHINIYQNQVGDGGGITVGCEQSDGIVEYINIYNNLVLNVSFTGIDVRGAWGDGLRKNINIYNNTIYGALPEGGNGGAGIYVTTTHLGSNNGDAPVIIRNNISMFYFLSSGGGTLGQIVAGNSSIASMITADHNLVYGPQKCSYDYPSCVEVGNRIFSNPIIVFSNPTAFDLHLKNGSPAIDKGLNINVVPNDFDGFPRPQPPSNIYDIGAYEFK